MNVTRELQLCVGRGFDVNREVALVQRAVHKATEEHRGRDAMVGRGKADELVGDGALVQNVVLVLHVGLLLVGLLRLVELLVEQKLPELRGDLGEHVEVARVVVRPGVLHVLLALPQLEHLPKAAAHVVAEIVELLLALLRGDHAALDDLQDVVEVAAEQVRERGVAKDLQVRGLYHLVVDSQVLRLQLNCHSE